MLASPCSSLLVSPRCAVPQPTPSTAPRILRCSTCLPSSSSLCPRCPSAYNNFLLLFCTKKSIWFFNHCSSLILLGKFSLINSISPKLPAQLALGFPYGPTQGAGGLTPGVGSGWAHTPARTRVPFLLRSGFKICEVRAHPGL